MGNFDHLPPGVYPFAVPLDAAAALVGVSSNYFGQLVEEGRMPQPREIGRRVLWDTEEVKAAWRAIPKRGEAAKANSWDAQP